MHMTLCSTYLLNNISYNKCFLSMFLHTMIKAVGTAVLSFRRVSTKKSFLSDSGPFVWYSKFCISIIFSNASGDVSDKLFLHSNFIFSKASSLSVSSRFVCWFILLCKSLNNLHLSSIVYNFATLITDNKDTVFFRCPFMVKIWRPCAACILMLLISFNEDRKSFSAVSISCNRSLYFEVVLNFTALFWYSSLSKQNSLSMFCR